VNALSGDTSLFAEVDDKYGVYMLKELYELHNQGHKIKVPTLIDEHGNKGWIEVDNVVSFGKQPLKRITLATTRLYVEATEGAIIPAFGHHLFSGRKENINLKFKLVKELKVREDPRHNDTLLLATRIPLNLSESDQADFDFGFALGFFLAEGNFKYRKHKNTKHSLAKLKALARKKGMTLQKYLEFMTNIERACLSVGQSDFERGYIDILRMRFKFSKPYKAKHSNAYTLCTSDLSFFRMIKDYIDGFDSYTKHLKNEAYNRSWKFLEGILYGFLAGDGSYYKKLDLFRVNMTANYKLRSDLIFLSKALGYDAHLHNGSFEKSPSSNNYYYHLHLNIFKTYHRRTALGLVRERIKKIEDVDEKEAFNLILKPLYPENDKRYVFNHLFFTAYGFLVSDAVKTLDRSVLSYSLLAPVLG